MLATMSIQGSLGWYRVFNELMLKILVVMGLLQRNVFMITLLFFVSRLGLPVFV